MDGVGFSMFVYEPICQYSELIGYNGSVPMLVECSLLSIHLVRAKSLKIESLSLFAFPVLAEIGFN